MRSRATKKRKDAEDPREEEQELQLFDWYVHSPLGFGSSFLKREHTRKCIIQEAEQFYNGGYLVHFLPLL